MKISISARVVDWLAAAIGLCPLGLRRPLGRSGWLRPYEVNGLIFFHLLLTSWRRKFPDIRNTVNLRETKARFIVVLAPSASVYSYYPSRAPPLPNHTLSKSVEGLPQAVALYSIVW